MASCKDMEELLKEGYAKSDPIKYRDKRPTMFIYFYFRYPCPFCGTYFKVYYRK